MDELDRASAPKVRLGGKDWPLPDMAVKRIMKLLPLFRGMAEIKWDAITETDLKVCYDICYIALTQGTPDLKREEFDELPIKLNEVIPAIPVIGKAAGFEPPTEGDNPGEAQAES